MESINFNNGLKYAPHLTSKQRGGGNFTLKTTFSPKKLVKFMDIYEKERNESFRLYKIFESFVSTTLLNFRLRILENANKEMLAGYTYKIRENKLEEKSMFVECLARKRTTPEKDLTKKQMTRIYEDIKKTAKEKKAKEITLFVYANEPSLRRNYEKLGFKIDTKCKVEKMYLLRVRVKDFLENAFWKTRKYKEAVGIDSILRKAATTF